MDFTETSPQPLQCEVPDPTKTGHTDTLCSGQRAGDGCCPVLWREPRVLKLVSCLYCFKYTSPGDPALWTISSSLITQGGIRPAYNFSQGLSLCLSFLTLATACLGGLNGPAYDTGKDTGDRGFQPLLCSSISRSIIIVINSPVLALKPSASVDPQRLILIFHPWTQHILPLGCVWSGPSSRIQKILGLVYADWTVQENFSLQPRS